MAKNKSYNRSLSSIVAIVSVVGLVLLFGQGLTGAALTPEIAREGNQVCIFTDDGITCTQTGKGTGVTWGIPREVREGNMQCYFSANANKLICEGVEYSTSVATAPAFTEGQLICWRDATGAIACDTI